MEIMKRYLYAALAIALAASCQSQIENIEAPANEQANLEQVNFVAGMPGTKTAIGAREGNASKATWVAGDNVAVYSLKDDSEYTKTTTAAPYEFTAKETGATTTLAGAIEKNSRDEYQAFYPMYDTDIIQVNYSSGKVNTKTYFHILPEEQTGTGVEGMISAVGSEADGFQFTHESSMFIFEIPASLDKKLSKVEISNLGTGFLCGKVQINSKTFNVAAAKEIRSTSIHMVNAQGFAAGTYYLVSLPIVVNGINIVTYGLDGEKYNTKKIEKDIDLRSAAAKAAGYSYGGVIANIGAISEAKDAEPDPTAYAYPTVTPAFSPILAMIKFKTTSTASNATLSDTALSFSTLANYSSEGQAIKFSGMTKGKIACTDAESNGFTVTNIQAGGSITFVIPVTETVSGDVEFTYNFNSTKPADATGTNYWTVDWSTDETNWTAADAVYDSKRVTPEEAKGNKFTIQDTGVQAGMKVAEFSLPNPVSSGFIYVRMTSSAACATTTQTTRCNYGFCLAPRTVNTEFPSSVILSQNFESARQGANVVTGKFMGLFTYVSTVANVNKANIAGYTFEGTCPTYRGLVCFGAPANPSEMKGVTIPALSNLSETADVVLTFKIAPYVARTSPDVCDAPNLKVTVSEGNGTPGDIIYDKSLQTDKFTWHVACCRIKGADATTVLRIGAPAAAQNNRFFLDDIVIVKEK